jgi:hypothetical protein
VDASGYGLQLAGPPGVPELGLGFPGQQPGGPLDPAALHDKQQLAKKPSKKKGGAVGQVAPLPQQQAAPPQQLQQVWRMDIGFVMTLLAPSLSPSSCSPASCWTPVATLATTSPAMDTLPATPRRASPR